MVGKGWLSHIVVLLLCCANAVGEFQPSPLDDAHHRAFYPLVEYQSFSPTGIG